MSALPSIAVIFLCLLLQALFAASEMAVISANRLRVRHLSARGRKSARLLRSFIDRPERFLATTLVGINLVVVLNSTVASRFFSETLKLGDRLGPVAATAVVLPLVLIFAEIVPKTLVRARATQLGLTLAFPLRGAYFLLYPLVRSVSFISSLVIGLLPGGGRKAWPLVDREDLHLLLKEGQRHGVLTSDEKKMITRVINLGANRVEDVMVPLIDVVAAPETARVEEVHRLIHESGHTRIPIYRDRIDRIIGTIQATDLLLAGSGEPVRGFIRPPYIVPEGKPLEELLDELRTNDVNITIVVDEYGGVSGIVTLENILEEIVGEIRDEYDVEEPAEYRYRKGRLEVKGRMSLEALNELLGLRLPEGQAETVAGLIMSLLGRIPSPGEKISCAGHLFTVLKSTDRRLETIAITGPAVRHRT